MSDTDKMLLDQTRLGGLINEINAITLLADASHFNPEDLEVRLELADAYWKTYQDNDIQLQRCSDSLKDRGYFKSNHFTAVFQTYMKLRAWYKRRIRENTPAIAASESRIIQNAAIPTSATQASLEKLQLPKFTGNQREWDSFKEKFTSLVINDTSMPAIVKLQRLSNSLGGAAADKLHALEENFQTAWETLCKRYDNKYLRFSLQMQALVRLPSASTENVQHLSQLLNAVDEGINTFKSLNRPVDRWDDILVYFIESKLSTSTRLDWVKDVERKNLDDFPKYNDLKTFLEDRIRTLDLVESDFDFLSPGESNQSENNSRQSSRNTMRAKKDFGGNKSTGAHLATHSSRKDDSDFVCSFCKARHFVAYCNKFRARSVTERRAFVKSAKLCFNCLIANHVVDSCRSKGRCNTCEGKHHTRLHVDAQTISTATVTTNEESTTQSSVSHATTEQVDCYAVGSQSSSLLSTACVILQAPNGQAMTVRALLDSGAEETFITEHVAQALSLRKQSVSVVVSGVGGSTTAVATRLVTLLVKSKEDSNFSFEFSALVLKRSSAFIPKVNITNQHWPHIADLELADPSFGIPGRIDCILNSEAYAAVLLPGIRRGLPDTPIALLTVFGWVLMGAARPRPEERSLSATATCHIAVEHDLTEAVSRFWEIEEISRQSTLSPSEQACYEHFRATHTRNEQGRYVVRLPFITTPQLSGTREIATACMHRLERRFSKQTQFAGMYEQFMQEYAEMSHMEIVPESELDSPLASYTPHHGVLKKDNSKLRVVFNALQQDMNGVSLNSVLHVGPKLQEDVIGILVRWSFLPYVFTCDVVKMFRQFLIHPEDCDWQRIIWRNSADSSLQVWRLLTVTWHYMRTIYC